MTTIRKETAADIDAVRVINEQAFEQSQEAEIVDRLRTSCDNLLSLVAERDGQVVGHILFSPANIEVDDGVVSGMGLAPMAVLPEYQRDGIGSALVEHGLSKLRDQGCPFVIVLGHPEYYPRFGFEPASQYGVACQWEGVPDEAFMIFVMGDAALQGENRVARYRDEFSDAM